MSVAHALAAQAARLNRAAGGPPIPALFFFTDPARTPDPCAVARRLPRGAAVVYRHFGAADRRRMARRLAAIARGRGLALLIAADPLLAERVGADGVHWPQRLLPRTRGPGLVTAAAHDAEAIARAEAFGGDACVLGPVFETRSESGNAPLGLVRASQMARAARVPVIALGGITPETAARLSGRGFAGVAAVEALAKA
jgi:thiamine-phosphate pyrophosphorylase